MRLSVWLAGKMRRRPVGTGTITTGSGGAAKRLRRMYWSANAKATRLLLGPGPSNVPADVLEAMGQPLIGHLDPAFLDLLEHRDLSNEIAERSGVKHESPQAILLRDGKAIWNASHMSITSDSLLEAVKNKRLN